LGSGFFTHFKVVVGSFFLNTLTHFDLLSKHTTRESKESIEPAKKSRRRTCGFLPAPRQSKKTACLWLCLLPACLPADLPPSVHRSRAFRALQSTHAVLKLVRESKGFCLPTRHNRENGTFLRQLDTEKYHMYARI